MITLTEIQTRLATEIKNSNLTQSEIARRLNIRHTQISCYVHGKKLPALDTFANLCVVLDVDPAEILGTTNLSNSNAQNSNIYITINSNNNKIGNKKTKN